ncbi:hypothetical protein [Streptomyces sp. NL15-2K]|uniref:hypothetical protein n=1 Tax=Streptomyces sp. NL15-2K TaxID=376149 RepID=UPI000F579D80|nr:MULTISPECIES: hypothetical protein [Actinomycetes]WKX09123.1 hypothetical protein Q4V64_17135 [Kutzneria buriramensis]
MTDNALHELAETYVTLWNEPDPVARRTAVRSLWAADGAHVLHPSEEIRKAAAGLGFGSPALEAHGHEAIETRVTRAYEDFVATGELTFALGGTPVRLRDAVKLTWRAVRTADGVDAGGGLDILLLDRDGRIVTDYQFPD